VLVKQKVQEEIKEDLVMKELEIADLEKLAAKYPKNSTLYLGRIE